MTQFFLEVETNSHKLYSLVKYNNKLHNAIMVLSMFDKFNKIRKEMTPVQRDFLLRIA